MQSFTVNPDKEIIVLIPAEQGGALAVTMSDPKWKPGDVIQLEDGALVDLRDQLFGYTQTGKAPTIGSETAPTK